MPACVRVCTRVCVPVRARVCVRGGGDARLQTCSVVIPSICSRWQARWCQRGRAGVCARVCECLRRAAVRSARARPRLSPAHTSDRGLPASASRLSVLCAPCRFYRNQYSAGPLRRRPAREHAQCKPLVWLWVWVSSKWHAGLRRDPWELSRSPLCAEGGGGVGVATHLGSPTAGTMLACLTRGNLLDALQEGFNEVTVLYLPPRLPATARLPPSLRKGILGAGIFRGEPS